MPRAAAHDRDAGSPRASRRTVSSLRRFVRVVRVHVLSYHLRRTAGGPLRALTPFAAAALHLVPPETAPATPQPAPGPSTASLDVPAPDPPSRESPSRVGLSLADMSNHPTPEAEYVGLPALIAGGIASAHPLGTPSAPGKPLQRPRRRGTDGATPQPRASGFPRPTRGPRPRRGEQLSCSHALRADPRSDGTGSGRHGGGHRGAPGQRRPPRPAAGHPRQGRARRRQGRAQQDRRRRPGRRAQGQARGVLLAALRHAGHASATWRTTWPPRSPPATSSSRPIIENLAIKQALYARIDEMGGRAIITSNTSGLRIADLMQGRSADFRGRFCITHFFNPPRYLKLVEIVAGADTAARDDRARRGAVRAACWARASCAPRTRPTSSPTASARSR